MLQMGAPLESDTRTEKRDAGRTGFFVMHGNHGIEKARTRHHVNINLLPRRLCYAVQTCPRMVAAHVAQHIHLLIIGRLVGKREGTRTMNEVSAL